ncbi:FAD synthetase [Streptomyces sp. NBRC 110611]|uniref:non-ribosomal peptide synthetase n=1 Tax=Streptomyces sp. NBRC 110611 TaxID=1621259 RepID=UPI000858233E|nr:non-ribosomal peptide synthetase [Streptomyces sp. NBRC 110611]GAU70358.1 FAD synthetase [Streptomyces sp. NBRC 110611]
MGEGVENVSHTDGALTPYRSAAWVFQEVAAEAAARPAVRHHETLLTYRDLAGAAGGVAQWLQRHTAGRGATVATLLSRSPRCAVAALGAWGAGAAYVHLDPEDPDERLHALLAVTRPDAILVDEHHLARLPESSVPVCVPDASLPTAPFRAPADADPEDIAYLVHTSGSTGTPKTVEVPHRAVLNHRRAFWRYIHPVPAASFGLMTTFAADLGLHSVFGALLSGARLDIYDRHTTLDPTALAAELRAHPVDSLKSTPSLLGALANQHDIAAFLPRRMLFVGGENFPPRLAAALLGAAPELPVVNSYGPSETTMAMMFHRITEADVRRPRIPVGSPIDGTRVRLLDDAGREVPDGSPGILYIGGQCLAHGYRGDRELTERKFTTDDHGERFYRSDDLMLRNSDGHYEFLGRADRQVKIRGYRVEPGEIEAALLALSDVRQAFVTGERPGPDPEAPLELVAYVAQEPPVPATEPSDPAAAPPAPAAQPSVPATEQPAPATELPVPAADLRERLRRTLPPALIPHRLHRVTALPVTPNGKVDVAALPSAVLPDPHDGPPTAPPRTETERLVAGIWSAVLGRTEIGRDDRFMEVGGDSLKALRVFAMLRRHHPGLTIGRLFEHPTVADLAAALDSGGHSGPSAPPHPSAPPQPSAPAQSSEVVEL